MKQFLKSYSSVVKSENGKITKDNTKEYDITINNDKVDGNYSETKFGKKIINKKLTKEEIKKIVEGAHDKYYIPNNIFNKALKQIQNNK